MLNRAMIEFILASIDNDRTNVPTKEARIFLETTDELRAQLNGLPPEQKPLKNPRANGKTGATA